MYVRCALTYCASCCASWIRCRSRCRSVSLTSSSRFAGLGFAGSPPFRNISRRRLCSGVVLGLVAVDVDWRRLRRGCSRRSARYAERACGVSGILAVVGPSLLDDICRRSGGSGLDVVGSEVKPEVDVITWYGSVTWYVALRGR